MSNESKDNIKKDGGFDFRLNRGFVWCHKCGYTKKVNSSFCIIHGWPKCCNTTMSLDSPIEKVILGYEKS